MYKVLIADDELIIRNGICKLLAKNEPNLNICGSAKNGLEAIEMVKAHNPNILIIDINIPFLNGLKAIEEIIKISINIQIIIISGYDKFEYAKQAIELGVISYLVKPFNNEEFFTIIKKAKFNLNEHNQSFALLNKFTNKDNNCESIVNYIGENYCDSELNITTLCRHFNLGKTTLGNTIKAKTGKTFTDYLTYLRIEHSKYLLENNSELSLNDISLLVGYSNQHYFSKVFKDYTNIAPSMYKVKNADKCPINND